MITITQISNRSKYMEIHYKKKKNRDFRIENYDK